MSGVLQRAKEAQLKVACETCVWIRLTLLQDLIAEIERLEAELLRKDRSKP